jgi:putative spermidine/putrescine transport system permease protein
MRTRTALALGAPTIGLLITLLVVPFANVLRLSLTPSGESSPSGGYSLGNYLAVVVDPYYLRILLYTVTVSALVTAVSAIIGFFVAYSLWTAPKKYKSTLVLIIVAPLMISLVIRIYGWVIILGDTGIINNLLIYSGFIERPIRMLFTNASVFIGMLHVEAPFMILLILAAMERIDPALINAAETLGSSRLRAIREIVLPLSAPGIAAGCTLVFTLCMTAFVTPQLLGSSSTKVLTTQVYKDFIVAFNWPIGATVAVLLCLCSLVAVAAGNGLIGRWIAGREAS